MDHGPHCMYKYVYLVLHITLCHTFSILPHTNYTKKSHIRYMYIHAQLPYVESLSFPYVKVQNLRVVPPYEHEFIACAKGRWLGRPIYEILRDEFISMDSDGLADSFSEGRVLVKRDGTITKCDMGYIVKSGDVIYHKVVVQEPPCLALAPKIVMDLPLVLVASKPVGLPVYPTGTYRYNTLTKVLKIEQFNDHSVQNADKFFDGKRVVESNIQLLPLHRIDRLVSGIVVFAKTTEVASYLSQEIAHGRVQKIYLARVVGKFPENATNLPLNDNGVFVGKGYVIPIDRKNGIHKFSCEPTPESDEKDMRPKQAETHFRFLSYNKVLDESLILCYPQTGRTHQIRAHLQYLNHPISNDPTYGDPSFNSRGMNYPPISHINWLVQNGNLTIENHDFYMNVSDKLGNGPIKGAGLRKLANNRGAAHCGGIFLHAIKYCWGAALTAEDTHPFWTAEFENAANLINSALAYYLT